MTLALTGYAALFGVADGSGDVIRPGAFARSLLRRRKGGLPMLWQHDPSRPIGLWTACEEDGHGLRVSGRLTQGVAQAEEAARLIGAQALSGLSIGFRALRAERPLPRAAGPGSAVAPGVRRVLVEIDLWEISLVTFPQMPDARVRLQAMADPAPVEIGRHRSRGGPQHRVSTLVDWSARRRAATAI